MAAYIGNKNAAKWTPELVIKYLTLIEHDLEHRFSVTLYGALDRQGVTPRIWTYWKLLYKDDEEIMDRMDIIMNKVVQILYEGALTGKFKASVAMFALKYNHHWTDKPKPEPTEELEMNPMIIEMSNDEIILFLYDRRAAYYKKIDKLSDDPPLGPDSLPPPGWPDRMGEQGDG